MSNPIIVETLYKNLYKRFVSYVYSETSDFPKVEKFVEFFTSPVNGDDYTIIINYWGIDSLPVPTKEQLIQYNSEYVNYTFNTFIKEYVKKPADTIMYSYQTILIPFQGPFEGTKTVSITILQQGAIITLQTSSLATVGNDSSAKIVSTEPVPYLFQPSIDIIDSLIVKNNGNNQLGAIKLTPQGFIEISADLAESPFSAGQGEYGSVSTCIQYLI